jgi:hypothetical protein
MDRATAIDKIRKMLATAASVPNTPEGQTARATAERWMREHQISEADLRTADSATSDLGDPDDLLVLCRAYTKVHGGSPEALARGLEDAVPGMLEGEYNRMRGVYTGRMDRFGRALDHASILARAHMDAFAPAFAWGIESAWVTRLTGGPRTAEEAAAAAGPPPTLPAAVATALVGIPGPLSEANRRLWQRTHVLNGWAAGMAVLDRLLGVVRPTPAPTPPGRRLGQLPPGIRKLPVR